PHRVHAEHLHVEDTLHGVLDLGLVGFRMHDERVYAAVERPVRLLRDDRSEDDVARIFHGVSPPSLRMPSDSGARSAASATTASVAAFTAPSATDEGACFRPTSCARTLSLSSADRVKRIQSRASTSYVLSRSREIKWMCGMLGKDRSTLWSGPSSRRR